MIGRQAPHQTINGVCVLANNATKMMKHSPPWDPGAGGGPALLFLSHPSCGLQRVGAAPGLQRYCLPRLGNGEVLSVFALNRQDPLDVEWRHRMKLNIRHAFNKQSYWSGKSKLLPPTRPTPVYPTVVGESCLSL